VSPLAVELAFAAADVGREHAARGMHQPRRSALFRAVMLRAGIELVDLEPVESGTVAELVELAYAIGRRG
jgi:hypothetical protein